MITLLVIFISLVLHRCILITLTAPIMVMYCHLRFHKRKENELKENKDIPPPNYAYI